MAWNTKRLLGLDIGTYAVKAVELMAQPGKAPVVTGMASAPVTNPNDLQSTVKEVLKRGAFRTRLTAANVSGRLVSIKYIPLPPMSDEETKKALYFEADKYIPFEVKDAFLDGQRIGGGGAQGAKESTAVLVAARRNLVLERAEIVSKSGLLPILVDVDAFAIGNAYETSLQASGAGAADRSVAIVDIGAAKTNINILRGDTTYFSREIYIAGNDFSDAVGKKLSLSPAEAETVKCSPGDQEAACREAVADVLEDLANEIRMSFEFYENQHETTVETVLLSGGSARLAGLPEKLGTVFGKPAKAWNPFEHLKTEASNLDAAALASAGGMMAVALGLASRLEAA